MLHTNRNRISPPVTTTVDMSHGLQVTRRYVGERDARQVVEALMRCHDS